MPVEQWLETLRRVERVLDDPDRSALMRLDPPIYRLVSYYHHLQDLARGYVQDQVKLEEQLRIIQMWRDEADQLNERLSSLCR
jgi:hypothetical protein